MTNEQLIERNRANAQHSTGPKTTEGKNRSRLSALRHGLTSKIVVAPAEELDVYKAHCKAYFETYQPVGIVEQDLVQEIADDRYRLKRARSIENGLFARGHEVHVDELSTGSNQVDTALAESATWVEHSKQLQLLTQYEGRLRRAVERNTAQLEKLQAERKDAFERAEREAIRLTRLAVAEGGSFDPADHFEPASAHGGFVFQPDAIERRVILNDRSSRAWKARHVLPIAA